MTRPVVWYLAELARLAAIIGAVWLLARITGFW